jgi:hypothetical protein
MAPAKVLLSETLIAAGQGDQRRDAPGGGLLGRLRLAGSGPTCSGAGMLLARGQPTGYAGHRGEMRV